MFYLHRRLKQPANVTTPPTAPYPPRIFRRSMYRHFFGGEFNTTRATSSTKIVDRHPIRACYDLGQPPQR